MVDEMWARGFTTTTGNVYYYGVDPAHKAEFIRSEEILQTISEDEKETGILLFDINELYD